MKRIALLMCFFITVSSAYAFDRRNSNPRDTDASISDALAALQNVDSKFQVDKKLLAKADQAYQQAVQSTAWATDLFERWVVTRKEEAGYWKEVAQLHAELVELLQPQLGLKKRNPQANMDVGALLIAVQKLGPTYYRTVLDKLVQLAQNASKIRDVVDAKAVKSFLHHEYFFPVCKQDATISFEELAACVKEQAIAEAGREIEELYQDFDTNIKKGENK